VTVFGMPSGRVRRGRRGKSGAARAINAKKSGFPFCHKDVTAAGYSPHRMPEIREPAARL
jgi:hypothetical protein